MIGGDNKKVDEEMKTEKDVREVVVVLVIGEAGKEVHIRIEDWEEKGVWVGIGKSDY